MRQLLHALIVATVAVAVLVGGAHAETLGQPGSGGETLQRPTLYARVVNDFGAAVRTSPSSDAPIMFNAECGDVWPVLATQGGWVKVQTGGDPGWIGGARVVVSSTPASFDCSDARSLYVTGSAWTYVPTGCLSLRARPSREATVLDCVSNGHLYTIVDGPTDAGTGEDWFRVTSPSTGSGWVLAQHLFPN